MQWTADQVQEEVVKLLQPFNPKGIELTLDTDLSADLFMDSVAAMNLVMEIEDRFEIDIPISLLPDVNTLQDLLDVVLVQLSKDQAVCVSSINTIR
jgi:acyl carrier protein